MASFTVTVEELRAEQLTASLSSASFNLSSSFIVTIMAPIFSRLPAWLPWWSRCWSPEEGHLDLEGGQVVICQVGLLKARVSRAGRGQVAGCSWPRPLIFYQVYGFCSCCWYDLLNKDCWKACGLKAVQIFQKMACWAFSFRRVNNRKILLFHGPSINLTVRGKVRTVRQGIWNVGSEKMSFKKICLSINVFK